MTSVTAEPNKKRRLPSESRSKQINERATPHVSTTSPVSPELVRTLSPFSTITTIRLPLFLGLPTLFADIRDPRRLALGFGRCPSGHHQAVIFLWFAFLLALQTVAASTESCKFRSSPTSMPAIRHSHNVSIAPPAVPFVRGAIGVHLA